MFESNFNFDNKEKETIAEEIRKLVSDPEGAAQFPSSQENSYLAAWKKNLLKLSGDN